MKNLILKMMAVAYMVMDMCLFVDKTGIESLMELLCDGIWQSFRSIDYNCEIMRIEN